THYTDKAQRIAALTRDLSELLPELVPQLKPRMVLANWPQRRLALHPPCTLQHGQQLRGGIEAGLGELGFEVELPTDSHLCCGSAGTYSVLQPELAQRLRERKLADLGALKPNAIVSANIGCIQHLQAGTGTPVRHWVEVVDQALSR
ncbi:MAG TPA: heterodisulfide reductase-related iron-sulfur binding cluster, partial [Burkholderiaceae bacterium]|nr:heterodisulfide reductase-related iron-sulfur binding cluster [Burkholderiaceae bacterium]